VTGGYLPTTEEVLNGFAAAQFVPHFQAILDLATGAIVGAEALARWEHPVHGVLGPELFLPPLARAGYLDELSWIMLALSAMEARSWLDAGLRTKVSVNVSATSLADPGYADSVTEIVSGHGIEPSQMTLELTETEAIMNVAAALENVTRLRMKGFGLAVDDFGVGYSSMHELSRMPFTEIKIDRAFVTAAAAEERPRLLIEQTVAIARQLGLKIVAEGVERRAERDMLERLGCDCIQGYFVAKPMEGRKFLEWMLERRANVRADGTAPAPAGARFGT
jgi:EAL domain-containing protein (putative c-di-GMP-specific phosphodiesterase class I)